MTKPTTLRTPNDGKTIAVVGDVYRFLATGDETDGRYALWEAIEETLATKQDIQLVRQEIDAVRQEIEMVRQEIQMVRQEIRESEARTDGRIKELEVRTDGRFRLIYWMAGFNLTLTVAILLKLFLG